MNNDLRQRVVRIFEQVDGGSSTDMWSMIDVAIEDGDITQEEWNDNEMDICVLFDDGWFTCCSCGWTMPIGDMGEDSARGELQCTDCARDEYGEEDE